MLARRGSGKQGRRDVLSVVWHWVVTGTLGLVAGAWILQALEGAWGVPGMPEVKEGARRVDAECRRVLMLFAGRDEAERMVAPVGSFLSVGYPDFEVVVVNDRSGD